jgi:hypothetical protein
MHHSRKAYSNACEDKTSLKFPDHNQQPESDNIKHSDLTGADNGNKRTLRGGQDVQTEVCFLCTACIARQVKLHKDASLDLLKCHYPFPSTLVSQRQQR